MVAIGIVVVADIQVSNNGERMKIEDTLPEWKQITQTMRETFKDYKWIDGKLTSLEKTFKKLEKLVAKMEKKRCAK